MRINVFCAIFCVTALIAHGWGSAEEWAPIAGADQVVDLVAGASAEIDLGTG